MANISVVFSKITKGSNEKKFYIFINEGSLNQMNRSIAFSVNRSIDNPVEENKTLFYAINELITTQLRRIWENPNYDQSNGFIVFVPLTENHFEYLKSQSKIYKELRSELEENIFVCTKIEEPNVKFYREDDFSRILEKEIVSTLLISRYEEITFPFSKDLIQSKQKTAELIGTLF